MVRELRRAPLGVKRSGFKGSRFIGAGIMMIVELDKVNDKALISAATERSCGSNG